MKEAFSGDGFDNRPLCDSAHMAEGSKVGTTRISELRDKPESVAVPNNVPHAGEGEMIIPHLQGLILRTTKQCHARFDRHIRDNVKAKIPFRMLQRNQVVTNICRAKQVAVAGSNHKGVMTGCVTEGGY